LRGRRRRRQGPGRLHVPRGQPHLPRRVPRLLPGDLGQTLQASIRPVPQRIGFPEGISATERVPD
ncbi:MAG: hypothetical protein ABWX85_12440, partial [Arthrobacter sp.]